MAIKKNKITKISIIILMLLLLFFSVNYFKVNLEYAAFKKHSELEIKVLESQLGEILHKYDSLSVVEKNQQLLSLAVDSVNQLNSNLTNDSVVFYARKAQALNAKIATKNQAILNESNNSKSITPAVVNRLVAININSKGVKIYSNVYKSNNSQIQQLRVCYTLQKNEIVKSGDKTLYIQVVNPKNQIISKDNSFVENESGIKLQYSAVSVVNYNKNDTDVCAYVDLVQNKSPKGKYIINIYSEFTKIGSSTFDYK
jgi:ABC-type sugar transport system ATPase subunit